MLIFHWLLFLMTLLLFLIRDKHPQHPSGLLVLNRNKRRPEHLDKRGRMALAGSDSDGSQNCSGFCSGENERHFSRTEVFFRLPSHFFDDDSFRIFIAPPSTPFSARSLFLSNALIFSRYFYHSQGFF